MNSYIKWVDDKSFGPIGPYILFVMPQAVIDLDIRFTWGVMLGNNEKIAEGTETVNHLLSLINNDNGPIADTIDKCKRKAEQALFELEANDIIDGWLTE